MYNHKRRLGKYIQKKTLTVLNSSELIFGCIFFNPNNIVFGIKSEYRIDDQVDNIDEPILEMQTKYYQKKFDNLKENPNLVAFRASIK